MHNVYDNSTDKKVTIKAFIIVFILLSSSLAAIFLKIESPQEKHIQKNKHFNLKK